MATIRPHALPTVTTADPLDKLIIDRSGSTARSITIDDALASRDPFATTPEATAGVVTNRKMSPATTAAAIDVQLPNTATGRAVLNAATPLDARIAIGAGDVKADGSTPMTGDLPFAPGFAPTMLSDGVGNQAARGSQVLAVSASLAALNASLGSAALLDVGSTAGTVAAGNDPRFSVTSPAYLSKRKTLIDVGATGGSGIDNGPALNAGLALLTPGSYVDGQKTILRVNSEVTVPPGIVLENITFDGTLTPISTYMLRLSGSFGASVPCFTSLSKGVQAVTVTTTAGLSRGRRLMFRQQCAWLGTVASINAGVSVTFTVADSTKYTVGQQASAKALLATVGALPSATQVRLDFAGTAAFSVGEQVWISNHRAFAIDQVFNTWWGKVRDVFSGTVLILDRAYQWNFTISSDDLEMFAPTFKTGNRFTNISAFRDGAEVNDTYFFRADLAELPVWEGGEITNFQYIARDWRDCIGGIVTETRVKQGSQDGAGYGDGLTQSAEDFTIENNIYEDNRHGVTMAGTSGITTRNKITKNRMIGSRESGVDEHPGAADNEISYNDIEVANRWRSGSPQGNREGIVVQGANARVMYNKIRGVGSLTTGSGVRDASFIQVQPFTRMAEDKIDVIGNVMKDAIGAGILGIFYSNAKPSGDLDGCDVSHNTVRMTDAGGVGVTSPVGAYFECLTSSIVNTNFVGNNINTRGTAITIVPSATKQIKSFAINGNIVQTTNTDNPVVFVGDGGVASQADFINVVGNTIVGGSNGYQRGALVGRDHVNGNIIRNFATAAISGAPYSVGTNLTT